LRRFEEEFLFLNNALLEMGTMVAQSIHRGVIALVERNAQYADQVLRDESRIDECEIRIDAMAASLIALEQPVASDMRLVVAAIKISTDLERMGDLAVNVASRALSLMEHAALSTPVDLAEIASMVESMVLRSLDAFVRRDAQVAHAVLAADGAVDAMREHIQRRVVDIMQTDSLSIERALDHLIIARSLERIADHAKNIAEGVIFLVQGIDVRHQPAGITR
jgi:phosphate transport system protein